MQIATLRDTIQKNTQIGDALLNGALPGLSRGRLVGLTDAPKVCKCQHLHYN